MNSEFMLSQGAGQKLEFAVQRNDGTSEDIDYLSTGENFRAVTLLRKGKVKLVEITETGSEGAVITTAPTPTKKWTVDDEGNIHFTLTSNGMTREQWEKYGFSLSDWGRNVLRLANEAPTNGVAYHIVVRPGSKISSNDRITKKIRATAEAKGWTKPHWEVACLIRENFSNEDIEAMGLIRIITMHEPIKDSGGVPRLLGAGRDDVGRQLNACYDDPGLRWRREDGFGFVVSQIVLETK